MKRDLHRQPFKAKENWSNLFQVDELSKSGQNDSDDGGDVEDSDGRGHDQLADRLLVPSDATLTRNAGAYGRDRKSNWDNQKLKFFK